MEPKARKYMVALRREILVAINGVPDAHSHIRWDDTTPNSTTRHRLNKILQNSIHDASVFGIYVVTRQSNCGRRSHARKSDDHGYVWTDRYNLNVKWLDSRFIWKGDQLFQGMRHGQCPCSQNSEYMSHHVIDDFIHSPDTVESIYQSVVAVLSDIQSAIEEAGDKKPRSGIREHLLRAILVLNDAIMPMTVDAYIAKNEAHLSELS